MLLKNSHLCSYTQGNPLQGMKYKSQPKAPSTPKIDAEVLVVELAIYIFNNLLLLCNLLWIERSISINKLTKFRSKNWDWGIQILSTTSLNKHHSIGEAAHRWIWIVISHKIKLEVHQEKVTAKIYSNIGCKIRCQSVSAMLQWEGSVQFSRERVQ